MMDTICEDMFDMTHELLHVNRFDPDEFEMPSEAVVNSWGAEGEQAAIRHMIDRSVNPPLITRRILAHKAGMSISQLTNLYEGFRGVPVKRFEEFTHATRSFALLKFYANKFHLVLKTQREWGKVLREKDEAQEKLEAIEAENAELKARLARYGEELGE